MPHSEHSIAAVVKSFSPLGSSYRFAKNKSQNGDRLIEHMTLSNHNACRSVFSGVQKWAEFLNLPRPNVDIIMSISLPVGGARGVDSAFFSSLAPPYKMVSSLTNRWIHGPVFCMSRCLGKMLNQAGGLPFIAPSTL